MCCIGSVEEAAIAITHGADAIGLVADMPSGPGIIDDDRIREIAAFVPPKVETFLLTSRDTADGIADHVDYCATSTVQIVRHIAPEEHQKLAQRNPAVRRVQVIHMQDPDALALLDVYQPWVHAFLLDSGRPGAGVVELGGTGRTHNWDLSAAFVRRAAVPVWLAGGLNAGNVNEAMTTVAPSGLDLCSGVRVDDRLDAALLDEFTESVWKHGRAVD